MGYEGFLNLGGREVVNTSRAHAAAHAWGISLGCDRCDDFSAALGHGPYRAPDDPEWPAPWWDPAYPESDGFCGVIGLDIEGMASSPATTNPTELLRGGSLPGPVRMQQREIAWTVLLVAVDECSLSYGMGWLAAALRGNPCGSDCGGDEACVLACCPTRLSPTMAPRQVRYLYSVAQLDGVEETERHRLRGSDMPCPGPASSRVLARDGGGVAAEVEFSLVAGRPWYYRAPVTIASQVKPRQAVKTAWTWNLPDECPEPVDCAADPDCDRPTPPPIPPVPPDPCVPAGGYVADLAMVRAAPGLVGRADEVVPVIHVDTGRRELRRIQIRFFANPEGESCEYDALDQCAACVAFGIGYVPPHSSLTIDGRVEQAWITCPDAQNTQVQTYPQIYGPGGTAVEWPVFGCGGGLCAWVAAEKHEPAGCHGPEWTATMQLVPRVDAI